LIQLGFTEAGVLDLWRLEGASGGAVSGITGAWPDFVVSFCGFCLEPFNLSLHHAADRAVRDVRGW
jgi:hypothetical protein